MPNDLNAQRLREYARAGAEAALKELRAEIIATERTFPELALQKRRHGIRKSLVKVESRARTMSTVARKAVSARMKRYWAERRKEKARLR